MPFNGSFQFGSEHRLILGADATGLPQTISASIDTAGATVGAGSSINDLLTADPTDFQVYDNIRDLNEAGNNQTVDITTRGIARQGLAAEVVATITDQKTFEILYRTRVNNTTVGDPLFEALLRAEKTKSEIFAIDIDGPPNQLGAAGQAGSYIASQTRSKAVSGAVLVSVTLSLANYGQWLIVDTAATSATNLTSLQFKALVDP